MIIPVTQPKLETTEWGPYVVPDPQVGITFQGEIANLDEISHVVHIGHAISIVTDQKIRPGLVFDKSKLNATRTLVCWLSPNHWPEGYRYGNIKFVFDWKRLLAKENIKYYWVEAIKEYNPNACRILLSQKDHSSTPGLTQFDPNIRTMPW